MALDGASVLDCITHLIISTLLNLYLPHVTWHPTEQHTSTWCLKDVISMLYGILQQNKSKVACFTNVHNNTDTSVLVF